MTERHTCCVCGKQLEASYHTLGGRAYCDEHYAQVNKPHPGFWRASVIQIVGMALFSVALAWIGSMYGPVEGQARVVIGLFLALVPSLLWVIYFYRQDHLEPEPKTKIAFVFVAGLLLAEVVVHRIVDEWFQVSNWASSDTITSLLASILIIGFTTQAVVYAAVRLVYATPEFDERMDGIVYGTVAGLGVAALLNLRYIIDNNGVEIAPGVIQTATTAMAQASFGGLLGYFMAEAKFTHRPIWWVPAGYALAATLNGLFSWLISEVSATGLTVDPWRSLGLGLAVALVVFLLLVMLMNRTVGATLARSRR